MLDALVPPWANPKNIAIAVLLVACVVLGVRCALLKADLRATQASEVAQVQKVADRDEQLRAANDSVRECQAANLSQQQALHAFRQGLAALRERSAEYEAQLAAARTAARAAEAAHDEEERAIEARPDVPPAAELNALARKRGEGWLWR